MKKNALLVIAAILLITMSASVSAVYLSDQGTGVISKGSGLPLNDGNLTIQIWDSPTSGSSIYNYTFINAIQNGTWNLIIGDSPGPNLNLSYGQIYYKDYLINGEDATFLDNDGSSIGRIIFQSPLGPINASYITGLSISMNETDPIWTSVANNYYNKTEVNNLISGSLNLTDYYNKTETDTQIINYVNSLNITNGTDGADGVNGTDGTSVNISNILDNSDGTYTWIFSDGTNFTTSNLTGPQGIQGPQGIPGVNGSDGADGADGVNGTSVTINAVINNGDGTFEWQFSNGYNFTTSNLTGPAGPQGPQGIPGVNGSDGADGADGEDGYTPYIQNNYWYINGTNTTVKAIGTDGEDGINGTDGIDGVNGTDGVDGTSVNISNVIDNTDGTYTWIFSDGTNFTTSNLTGPQGIQGPQGPAGVNGTDGADGADGANLTMSNITNNLDGTYTWFFSDGTNFTTSNLTGPQGIQGPQGIPGVNGSDGADGADGQDGINGTDGTSVNISNVIDNADGTYTWIFSDGTNFTTSNLTGPQGIQGPQGPAGVNGTDGADGVNGTDGTSFDVSGAYLYNNGSNVIFFNDSALPPDTVLNESQVDAFVSNNGYLTSYTETDPVFTGSTAYAITALNVSNWNDAHSWGDHSLVGYLTSYTETDPIFTAWNDSHPNIDLDSTDDFSGSWNDLSDIPADLADGDNDTQLNESQVDAFVANNGYLTSYTETDPVFIGSTAYSITASNISDWNNAFGWGDHALAGYLTSYTETDPVWTAVAANYVTYAATTNWDKDDTDDFDGAFSSLTGVPAGLADGDDDTQLNESQVDAFVSNNGYLTSYTETDTLDDVTSRGATTTNSITVNNVTIANGECLGGASGGYICFNSTHTWIG
jgi:hypothetical protein